MLICQLTDLHVRPRGVPCNRVSETNMLTERACRVVARFTPRPDVVVITGDLTDCGLPAEYENVAAILRRTLSLPIYVIPGNHDRRENLRTGLAHLPHVTDDPDFVQYVVDDYPVRLVMLDTLVPGANHGALSEGQLAWLDQTLAAAPSKPTLVAMHHPPFMTGLVHLDDIALRQAERFRAVIARHRQVARIIAGHHHRPIIGQCAHAVVSISPSVAHQVELSFDPAASGAFNFEPPAFQLHAWDEASGFVSHTIYTSAYDGPFPFLSDPDHPATD
ncbi:phosphodiesterase [Rhodopila globiformis]|uniref:Phosphodiesterase n=1 Tax=Rhodopila globiformis TaxID=1071 RepID=A0A2S6N1G2_RHOGL|nr:phosphodiesterase [Rhodopila globiformis]PPQ28452.1 phosphodiesterase [Rhodopila globiformis]